MNNDESFHPLRNEPNESQKATPPGPPGDTNDGPSPATVPVGVLEFATRLARLVAGVIAADDRAEESRRDQASGTRSASTKDE